MCGGFAGLYVRPDRSSILQHSLYHLGRLSTYLILGAIAGTIGRSLDSVSALAGIQRAASLIVGALLIIVGLAQLFGWRSKPGHSGLTAYLAAPFQKVLARGKELGSTFPYLLGVVSTLLPCGWLYFYLAVAAASGSATSAALIMTMFWAGTVPILLGIGLGLHRALPLGQRNFPRIAAVLLIAAGFFSFSGHLDSSAASGGCEMHMQHHSEKQADQMDHSHHHPSPE